MFYVIETSGGAVHEGTDYIWSVLGFQFMACGRHSRNKLVRLCWLLAEIKVLGKTYLIIGSRNYLGDILLADP